MDLSSDPNALARVVFLFDLARAPVALLVPPSTPSTLLEHRVAGGRTGTRNAA